MKKQITGDERVNQPQPESDLNGSFFWLAAFYFVYCARPGDWAHALDIIPFAKTTGTFAVLSLLLSAGRTPRGLKDLPREAAYLLILIVLLFASAVFSPVWRGGAFFAALGFAKVYVAWVLTFLLITTIGRLRRIIFIQAISVAAVSSVAVIKGHSVPRLEGVIGGIYSNSNDFAFAIVLSLPFCLAFFVSAQDIMRKAAWCVCALTMTVALLLTASRAGFIDLVISGTVCLWHLGIRGKRMYLIFGTLVCGGLLLLVTGERLANRFSAISDEDTSSAAYSSYEERKLLITKAADAIVNYPVLGVGAENFVIYSGIWQEVHASYLQIAAEGGILSLIVYGIFFYRGFANLKQFQRQVTDSEASLLAGALHSSLIGFVVGACFAPEAYQYFPYFAVCYTSVLVSISREQESTRTVSNAQYTASGHRIVGLVPAKVSLSPIAQ